MADKQKLLELDVDIESILAKSKELKTSIDSQREALSRLKKEGDTSSDTYNKTAANVKQLTTEYSRNQQQLGNLSKVNGEYFTVQDKIRMAIDKVIVSEDQAAANVKELTLLRKGLNLTTEDGQKAAAEINDKIDKNNKFIKDNVSQLERQKIGIGDYTSGILDSADALGYQGSEIKNVSALLDKASGVFKTVTDEISKNVAIIKDSIKAKEVAAVAENTLTVSTEANAVATNTATVAQRGLTTATNVGSAAMKIFALAVAATGIGLLIIVMALLIGYFKTFDPLVDSIEQGFAGFGAAVRVVQQALANFILSIKSAGDLMSKLGGFLSDPIGSLKELGKEMDAAATAAANLKEAQQNLADEQDVQSVNNKRQEAEIARLMLQAKNRSLSAAQQQALLQKADEINKKNFEDNARLADKEFNNAIENARIKGALNDEQIENLKKYGLSYAKYLLNNGKLEDEDVDRYKTAIESKIDIFNRATSNEEKIQNKSDAAFEKGEAKREAANKKAEEDRKKELDNITNTLKLKLDLFLSEQAGEDKVLSESLKIAERVKNDRIEIAKAEYNASAKTSADKLQLLINENNARAELLQAQSDLILQYSKAELDLYISENRSRLEGKKILTAELVEQERKRLESIKLDQLNLIEQEKQTNQELIDAKIEANQELTLQDIEYLTAKNNLETEYFNQNQANQKILSDQVKEQKAAQLVADNEIKLANAATELEQDLLTNQIKYDAELAQLQEQKDKLFLTEDQFNKKKKIASAALELEDKRARDLRLAQTLELYSGLGNAAQTLFGKNKALSTALALADTYASATRAYYSQFMPIPTVDSPVRGTVAAAAAVVSGLANVASINKIKLATGAVDLFGSGSGTSDNIPAMLSRGESVLTADNTATYKPLINAIHKSKGVSYTPDGLAFPSILQGSLSKMGGSAAIDYDQLAGKIAEANLNLPAPVLNFEDFHVQNNSYQKQIATADHL